LPDPPTVTTVAVAKAVAKAIGITVGWRCTRHAVQLLLLLVVVLLLLLVLVLLLLQLWRWQQCTAAVEVRDKCAEIMLKATVGTVGSTALIAYACAAPPL
jgi:cadmium resistance protein CadD (predicted permease)